MHNILQKTQASDLHLALFRHCQGVLTQVFQLMVLADYRVHPPARRVQIYAVPDVGSRARVLQPRVWQDYLVDQVILQEPLTHILRLFLTNEARPEVLFVDNCLHAWATA